MASLRTREAWRSSTQGGFTLIEVIVSIVVLAIAVAGVLGGLSVIAVRSANALVNEQAVAIASSYLNEVLQKPFGAADGKVARSQLDVVDDYGGLTDVGVHDQTGAPVRGLGQYTVTVRVGAGLLGAVPAAELREVDVTVSNASGVLVVLSGYRTQYP
ncbi:MAG: type IV pilus modification PilV family protein [Steroidobacteraceae bacterium]